MWEQAYNQKLYVFYGHTDSITNLQLSPDGEGFLSVSEDGCVKIWSLEGVVTFTSNGGVYDENGKIEELKTRKLYNDFNLF